MFNAPSFIVLHKYSTYTFFDSTALAIKAYEPKFQSISTGSENPEGNTHQQSILISSNNLPYLHIPFEQEKGRDLYHRTPFITRNY
jgi:hypothetical protein